MNHRSITRSLSVALLATAGWGFAANAADDCECLCVDDIGYKVCTQSFLRVTTVSEECSALLQCPALAADITEPLSEEQIEPPAELADLGVDCRLRNVYRPDLGEYKPHKVCMPAAVAGAHERLRAKRAEMAERYQERWTASEGQTHRGRGPHATWQD